MSLASSLLPLLTFLPLLLPTHSLFDENKLQGLYRRRVGIDGSPRCPDLFRFTTSGLQIPPSEILLDNIQCNGGTLFLTRNPTSHPNSGLVRYFSTDPRTGDFFAGDLSAPLICPPARFGQPTAFIFVRPDTDITITWADVVGTQTILEMETASIYTFRQNTAYIIVNSRCLYIRDDSPPIRIDETPACFPAHATVDVYGLGRTPIANLNTGDRVSVGNGLYSPVFAWTHRDATVTNAQYVRIDLAFNTTLVLTPGHMVYVLGRVVKARDVTPGHVMRTGAGGWAVVRSVHRVAATGLYNPQTVHGDIVVDGVLVTTYTSAVDTGVAHALLAPVRAAFDGFGALGVVEFVARSVLEWQTF